MNHEKLKQLLEEKEWTFAKTMAEFPHCYTLERNWEDKDLFLECWKFIKSEGKERAFFRKKYMYYRIGKYEYWAMHIRQGEGIINRAISKND
jgi:hypothetical protein